MCDALCSACRLPARVAYVSCRRHKGLGAARLPYRLVTRTRHYGGHPCTTESGRNYFSGESECPLLLCKLLPPNSPPMSPRSLLRKPPRFRRLTWTPLPTSLLRWTTPL